MPDFHQHARIPTLHHLAVTNTGEREAEIEAWTANKPVTLLLPALFCEFERPVLPGMLSTVSRVPYISEVVLSVNGMDAAGLKLAQAMCRQKLGDKPFRLIWNDGPAALALRAKLEQAGGPPVQQGKGNNVWTGLLSLLAGGFKGIVIGHDTDISSYGRELLVKLAYPLVHPSMEYRFAKGYYARVSGRLYGRVTRLLVFPLIQAFIEELGATPLLQHLESFRYPLAGEFAGDIETLGRFSLPSGWGLEIAMLCDAHRLLKPTEMCQVDIGSNFEHRHRRLDDDQVVDARPDAGLMAAATEVARCLFVEIIREAGPRAAKTLLTHVCDRYRPKAVEWVQRYEHVALLNGLEFHRAEELCAVEMFNDAICGISRDWNDKAPSGHPLLTPPAEILASNPALVESVQALAA
jgi:glucosyl-3-phosphoglycerate synthase